MGPGGSSNTLPSRPRLSCDSKIPSWADGKQNQERFKFSLAYCTEFHKYFPASNPNNLDPNSCFCFEITTLCQSSHSISSFIGDGIAQVWRMQALHRKFHLPTSVPQGHFRSLWWIQFSVYWTPWSKWISQNVSTIQTHCFRDRFIWNFKVLLYLFWKPNSVV